MSYEQPIPHDTLRTIYSIVAPAAVSIVNEGHECDQQLMVFNVLGDGEPELVTILPPRIIQSLHASAAHKDVLFAFVRDILHRRDADVVVHVTEAWATRIAAGEIEEGMRRYQDLKDAGVPLEHQPGRTETLMVTLHTRQGSCAGMMPIVGIPRRVKFAPLELEQMGSADFTGRMSMNSEEA